MDCFGISPYSEFVCLNSARKPFPSAKSRASKPWGKESATFHEPLRSSLTTRRTCSRPRVSRMWSSGCSACTLPWCDPTWAARTSGRHCGAAPPCPWDPFLWYPTPSYDVQHQAGMFNTKLGCPAPNWDVQHQVMMSNTRLGCRHQTGMSNTNLGCPTPSYDVQHQTGMSNTKLRCPTPSCNVQHQTGMSNIKLWCPTPSYDVQHHVTMSNSKLWCTKYCADSTKLNGEIWLVSCKCVTGLCEQCTGSEIRLSCCRCVTGLCKWWNLTGNLQQVVKSDLRLVGARQLVWVVKPDLELMPGHHQLVRVVKSHLAITDASSAWVSGEIWLGS